MARWRLRIAHELETRDGQRAWLPGDIAASPAPVVSANPFAQPQQFEETGTIVGDGTPYIVRWPTLEMIPLDEEAEEMNRKEEARLAANNATMTPVDDLPIDNYEENYIPGSNRRRREPLPDGAPVAQRKA